jgi:hypothetical protein
MQVNSILSCFNHFHPPICSPVWLPTWQLEASCSGQWIGRPIHSVAQAKTFGVSRLGPLGRNVIGKDNQPRSLVASPAQVQSMTTFQPANEADSSPTDLASIHEQQRADQLHRDALNVGLLRLLPFCQAWITWQMVLLFTGQSLRQRHRLENLATALVAIAISLVLSHHAIHGQEPWATAALLLLLAWGHLVFGLRNLALPNRHEAAHGTLTGIPWLDAWIGQSISAVNGSPAMSLYRATHVVGAARVHHSARDLMTSGESTFEELRSFGIQAGASPAANWCHLRRTLLDPRFYGGQLLRATHAAFFTGLPWERAYAVCLWLAIVALLVFTQELDVFLIVFIPSRLLYVVSQVLRSLAEHRFGSAHPRSLAVAHGMTVDIYCVEKPPLIADHANHLHNALLWLSWAARMILIHMPTRFWVLTGSTPAHWQHHFARLGHDFANYEMEKSQLLEKGLPIQSVWGLRDAIGGCLNSLAQQPDDLFERP